MYLNLEAVERSLEHQTQAESPISRSALYINYDSEYAGIASLFVYGVYLGKN